MPELPEVQTTVNGINAKTKGQIITDVWTDYGGSIHAGKDNIKNKSYFKKFLEEVSGAKILGAERRGKNILINLSGNHTLLIHMKMTGHMMYGSYRFDKAKKKDPWTPEENQESLKDPFNKFIHFVLSLSSGKQLVLSDMRKFAKVTLLETDSLHDSSHLKGIGPEPLDTNFTFPLFKERLMKRKTGRVKNVLMTPEIIAGIGNIYSDEALWRAGIHPESKPEKIPEKELKLLYTSILEVLKKGIDFGGDSMSDYRNIDGERGKFQAHHNAYRLTKSLCKKKDGGTITRKIVGGRSAHFCNVHQKLYK